MKTVRSCARALKKDAGLDKIPQKRKAEMASTLLKFFKVDELTPQIIEEAAEMDPV